MRSQIGIRVQDSMLYSIHNTYIGYKIKEAYILIMCIGYIKNNALFIHGTLYVVSVVYTGGLYAV